ncbi:cytochrome c oxidase accessory protein CcoG [Draconibacterium halophilum]|uniref:Cytochrome c oxidase accessory protein CcoG n=1 Tax=Draconibacterium halophilum TaxID=2706887 RepID=A0A6C0RG70_9BACT|nr:cytochrome c oxidase accessory protein CcoG [Draconibacterium halophilum]QIA09708.1 cytochrome c oxidase accessory protein CcoG [Draconibacterium halophilum]
MTKEKLDFRDYPINWNERGGRKWVYAKKPSGKWFNRRTIVSWILLLFWIAVPFIRVNGNPLILLDIANRKFIIFGAIFWAQDTFILALLMLSFVLFVVLFTVTFGRLWCGWTCPQTIFLEMVFRKIEYLIEGDYRERHKLDNSPWTTNKIVKKALKHTIFILISVAMTNVFLMWFIGSERWLEMIQEPITQNISGFAVMLLVSAFFYWVYSFFREQICTMVCPYGRMQGVLLDSKSIAVTYDYVRGEPRGGHGDGDCTDCKQCISVCPTGIDIRNGSQLECVNCSACIDQCNKIMHVTGKPPGLIRYASEAQIKGQQNSIWNARNRAYSVVLLLIFSFFVYTLVSRPVLETTILRTPGLLYQEQDSTLSNVYNIKIVNKTHDELPLELRVISHKGKIQMAGNTMLLKDQDMYESTFILFLPKSEVTSDKTKVEFGVFSNNELIETYKATFVGP